jgi:hypothetical protein
LLQLHDSSGLNNERLLDGQNSQKLPDVDVAKTQSDASKSADEGLGSHRANDSRYKQELLEVNSRYIPNPNLFVSSPPEY